MIRVPRRTVLQGGAAAAVMGVAAWRLPGFGAGRAGAADPGLDAETTSTLEAFADTVVPGNKRFPGDVAVAGVAAGPSAAAAGALDVLQMTAVGLAPVLPGIAMLLNGRAAGYAGAAAIALDPALPPYVALSYPDRYAVLASLVPPSPTYDRTFILMTTMVSWAFDDAAAQHTVDAIKSQHKGLLWTRFPLPSLNGVWRFSQFSYQLRLGRPHSATTSSGSPA